MIAATTRRRRRHGVAAVEFAVVAPLLFMILFGLWEVGRIVEVTQIIDNATREGGRLAASGSWTASNVHPQMNLPSSNTDYEVQRKVLTYITDAGLQVTGATVTVTNNTQGWSGSFTAGTGVTTTVVNPGTDPAANANPTAVNFTPGQPLPQLPPLDQITVNTQIPYGTNAWKPLTFIYFSSTLQATAVWRSARNIPLTFDTTIPSVPVTVAGP